MRRKLPRFHPRASMKQKLFIRILTREPICRSGRSLIIYYYYYYYYYHHVVCVLPQLSAHRSSSIVIHRLFETVMSRNVTPCNEKFVSRYCRQNTSLRDEIRAPSWRQGGWARRVDIGRKYYPFAVEKLHY